MGSTVEIKKASKKTVAHLHALRNRSVDQRHKHSERFVLTSVSKEELDDRRIPVYPYVL